MDVSGKGDPKFGCSIGEGPGTYCAEVDGWLDLLRGGVSLKEVVSLRSGSLFQERAVYKKT